MINLIHQLSATRQAIGLSQEALATHAGLSRMTVQRTESGNIDPRLSSLIVMARAMDMELMLVPSAIRPDLEEFARSGGKFLGQPEGVGAPPSIVDTLLAAPRSSKAGKAES